MSEAANVMVGQGAWSARQSSEAAIEQRIANLRQQADNLEALLNCIRAGGIDAQADAALWHLVVVGH